jgi:hypothetical protein
MSRSDDFTNAQSIIPALPGNEQSPTPGENPGAREGASATKRNFHLPLCQSLNQERGGMTISKGWMEMTPKKELRLFRLKCYRCGQEIEAFSDELDRRRKCAFCKEIIDPGKCEVIQVH